MQWLAATHPELVGRYKRLYSSGSYASKEYRSWLAGKVRYFKARHGFGGSHGFSHRDVDDPRGEEAAYPEGSIPQAASRRPAAAPSTQASQPTLF